VKAATGEVVSAEDLGGADVHCKMSGVTDHYAVTDEHALSIARSIISSLNYPSSPGPAYSSFEKPLFGMEDMASIIPADTKKNFDVRKVHLAYLFVYILCCIYYIICYTIYYTVDHSEIS
jgi:3-methylcrotonyl-CoA carboxylase beta subunit